MLGVNVCVLCGPGREVAVGGLQEGCFLIPGEGTCIWRSLCSYWGASLPATHGRGRWTQEIPHDVRGRWQEALPIPVFQQNGQPVPIQPSPRLTQPACTRGCQKPEPAIPCPISCRVADSGEVERLQHPLPAGGWGGLVGNGLEKGRHEGVGQEGSWKVGSQEKAAWEKLQRTRFSSLVAGKQRRSASKTPFCCYYPDQSQTRSQQTHPFPSLSSCAHTHVLVSLQKNVFWLG